jgi:hypothetical protein
LICIKRIADNFLSNDAINAGKRPFPSTALRAMDIA